MSALGKLFRTTAFKLTIVYLIVFALFAGFLLGYFAWNTRRLITEQITETVDAEIRGLTEQYRLGGIRRLVFAIDGRARRPGSNLYLVTTAAGEGLAGTGDELDRLASNLTAMLERIEALMRGLKEVTDNIAHDLKTPLTRLRNRCEEALRTAEDESQYRAALEATIEESDALIRTFNALLMIARAESGQARDNMSEFDAAEIARGVGDLYEPLADDKGLVLKVEAPDAAPVRGNRELVSQVLANLVDNAIKYAAPDGARVNGTQPEIVVKAAAGEGDRILLTVADAGPGIPA